jgi:hypothetical protein
MITGHCSVLISTVIIKVKDNPSMAKSKVGARVKFCNHDGWFIADIYEIAGANVIRANGEVNHVTLNRKNLGSITHRLIDFPVQGFFRPDIGVFVVPSNQVTEVTEVVSQ